MDLKLRYQQLKAIVCVCICVYIYVCVCVYIYIYIYIERERERERERETTILKPYGRDFLGSQMVENLPSKAEDAGLITGPRTKIPQAMTELSHVLQLEKTVRCSEELAHCSEDPAQPKSKMKQKQNKNKPSGNLTPKTYNKYTKNEKEIQTQH